MVIGWLDAVGWGYELWGNLLAALMLSKLNNVYKLLLKVN